MADIFISYSKADRFLVEQLAAYLETEGWSVWFDRSLTAGDTFRDEIIKELARARAVIAIWTETSVKSDWVRAEAGRAKAEGKLLPVKTSGLAYEAIPLPFGEMHTETIEKVELIRAAVIGLLARPQTAPAGLPLLGAAVRSEVLMWFGIIGGAITLFTNLRGVLQLADWARELVDNWRALAHALWSRIGTIFNIAVTADQAIVLNCYTFFLALILGTRLAYLTANRRVSSANAMERTTLLSGAPWTALAVCIFFLALNLSLPYTTPSRKLHGILLGGAMLLYFANDRFGTILFLAMMKVTVFVLERPLQSTDAEMFGFYGDSFLLGISAGLYPAMLALSPVRRMNRRLIFILIGVALLLGLNELSKLHLGQYLKT